MLFSKPHLIYAQVRPEQILPEVKLQCAPQAGGFKTGSTGSATRTESPLRDLPQIINTVPQALIRSHKATTLQDALRNVPGISYASAEGGTLGNQAFYLRGFHAGGDLFLDGIRGIGEYNRGKSYPVEAAEPILFRGGHAQLRAWILAWRRCREPEDVVVVVLRVIPCAHLARRDFDECDHEQ